MATQKRLVQKEIPKNWGMRFSVHPHNCRDHVNGSNVQRVRIECTCTRSVMLAKALRAIKRTLKRHPARYPRLGVLSLYGRRTKIGPWTTTIRIKHRFQKLADFEGSGPDDCFVIGYGPKIAPLLDT